MKLRVFLTGASGYLGSVLIEHLARSPEVETITGIGLSKPRAPLPAKATFVRLDIRSPDLPGVMAGHNIVVHTAAIVLWPAKMSASEREDINLNGVCYVAKAALANQVRRFVHASSMAVYDPQLARGKSNVTEDFPLGRGDSPFYYWNGKAVSEQRLTELLAPSSITLTCLRPIYIIGPRNRSVLKKYRQNAVNLLGYDPRRQFVHEDDVAAAFVQAVHTDLPGAFNVVPDDFIRLSEMWPVVGRRIVPTVPLWLARLITAFKWRFLGSPVHPCWVEDMLVDLTGSNAKLKSVGWKPQFNSLEALRAAL